MRSCGLGWPDGAADLESAQDASLAPDVQAVLPVWTRYREDKSLEARNALVVFYAPLVKFVVSRMLPHSVKRRIEAAELINCGMIGLIEAIERFTGPDPRLFPKYAPFRIRGAIIDELRRQDWVPRRTREKAKALEAARERLETALRRSPERADLARALGLAEVAFDALLTEVAGTQVVSLSPGSAAAGSDWTSIAELVCSEEGPDGTVLAQALSEQVRRAMDQLSERERRILVLAYIENLTQVQIGEILGVSHSRVSQLKKRALAKLRHLLAAVDADEGDLEPAAV